MRLRLKIVPRASRNEIVGWFDEALKIRVSANPEKGKANEALIKLLANAIDIPLSTIEIISGHTNAHKVIEIRALSEQEILARITLALASRKRNKRAD